MTFDAVVLATGPHAQARVLGLTLAERGERVAAKVGARRVLVLDESADLAAWDAARGDAALLVIDAREQLVHTPLVEPLLRGSAPHRIAVDTDGTFAGALWLSGAAPVDAIARGALPTAGGEPIQHGEIARHPARTSAERRAAARMLERILVKAEDSPIVRFFYRPLSRPITRLLLHTPITPNQVSIVVLALGVIGCWLTAQPGQNALIAGAALILAGGIIDGCDGELSRLRLTSSKLGAWLDTVIDELTTTLYFIALGNHVLLYHRETWVVPSIIVGALCYVTTIYVIYFFLIVVSKTGNSQHYVGDLELAGDALRKRHRPPSKLPPWLQRIGNALMMVVRRDFINLVALAVTFVDGYLALYFVMFVGGVAAAAVVVPEHLKLRGMLRELARRGATPRLVH
jgi:phosphatidylglycerophosphate synthase